MLDRIILILILCININFTSACSKYCTCKWKNGKQTIECSNKNLDSIPTGMSADMQILEFSGNKLEELSAELFMKIQLVNLQRIFLSNCRIKRIHDDAFKGLSNLVELDLSNNYIEHIPTDSFRYCPSLMRLILNFNPIHTLRKFSFNYLTYLNTLELSNCSLFDVEEGAFQGLHSLEWLHLDGNRLKTIPGRKTLPDNIKGVELQKNAWECDCHIQDLHAWLLNFNIPLSAEPVCKGPPRLSGRNIKSIATAELACLPDISPTAFYLELGEGKNVSLLCHVYAKPEASVSWWFQGRILQNNTLVAPGLHLIYFVEEGVENKRTELFIYNANADDNGTFVCNAENAAGSVHSNFTIRILLKEDPIVIIVAFPFEYFLYVIGAAIILAVIIIIVIIVLIIRCHRRRSSHKRKISKEETLQYEQDTNGKTENAEAIESTPELNATSDSDDMIMYGVQRCEAMLNSLSPITNQIKSPSSLRRYQLEQNPDLINGTESGVGSGIGFRRDGDGADQRVCKLLENEAAPVRGLANVRCVLDSQGYPIDYGLPKLAYRKTVNDNYYRTLPCKRFKRQQLSNPINRYSREAEYISRSLDCAYDYQSNVRYTADGYPERAPEVLEQTNFTHDNSAPLSLPCCSTEWPTFLPANLHTVNSNRDFNKASVSKRCVSAQTDSECDEQQESPISAYKTESGVLNSRNNIANEVLTESPDEGYEGETSTV